MAKSTESKKTRRSLFRVKLGHVVLGFIAIASLVTLIFYSVSALQAHELDKRAVLSQEGDAAAMTFVQRESFNVLLDFQEWSQGELTSRDVQISRAMLGQRLAVITQSGQATYEQTEQSYRVALAGMDDVIMGMKAVDDNKRPQYEKSVEVQLKEFASATRYLSQTFEKITREAVAATVEARVLAEVIQAVLLGLVMLAGGALGTWVTVDIVRGFRQVQRKIQDQRERLEWTRRRLLLVQTVDEKSRELIKQIHLGKTTASVVAELKSFLNSLAADLELIIEINGFELEKFDLVKDATSDVSDEDLQFMSLRLNEVVQGAINRDVQARMLAYEREFDGLTGLANRTRFTSKVDANVSGAKQDEVSAIIVIDIDRFRDINASLGYKAGDTLLKVVGAKLTEFAVSGETVARLSGDEFGLTGRYASAEAAKLRADELLTALKFTANLNGVESEVSSSVGVAVTHEGIVGSVELARCASLAIYLAKSDGARAGFTMFSPREHQSLLGTWQEEIAVRNALRSGEFVMHFQPIISLASGEPVGAEALIRWQRPGTGLVMPDDFLTIVNRAGLSIELGSEVIRESLATWSRTLLRVFREAGYKDPYISINVDAPQLEDPGFADFVIAQAANFKVPATAIVLEVTEHTLAAGQVVTDQLSRLRELGMRIALDDFGTGYSNLGQAKTMPLDILKIDKSFLNEFDSDDRSHRLVSDVTQMAKGQDLQVTAEGIETQVAADLLAGMTVDFGQGYHYSKALSEADFESWISKRP
jgi:diguanylate cyclase (GGDEF)-like protein